MKLLTSLLCLPSTFCSDQCSTKRLRDHLVSLPSKRVCLDKYQNRSLISTLPSDMLSSITSFLNSKTDQQTFINLSSKNLSLEILSDDLKASKRLFLRGQSLQIVRSADLIKKIHDMYTNSKIYPITLTFHQDDLPLLRNLDVFSFIRRVQTVVFEGAERMVIDANHESRGLTQGHDGI